MSLDLSSPEEVRSLLKAARKRPLNFGLCLGKKPEGLLFVMHRTKPGKALAIAAKKEGETPKIAFGSVWVDGKEMNLKCESKVLPMLAKTVRKYLRSISLSLKVIIQDETGQVVESFGDEDEADGDTAAPAEQAAPPEQAAEARQEAEADPARDKWLSATHKVKPRLARALKDGSVDVSKLRAWWSAANGAAGEEDYVTALKILARIVALLTEAAGAAKAEPAGAGGQAASEQAAAKPDPNAAKWVTVERALQPRLKAAFEARAGDLDRIRKLWAFATGKAEQQDFDSALKAAAEVHKELARAAQAAESGDVAGQEASGIVKDKAETLQQAEAVMAQAKALTAELKEALKVLPDQAATVKALLESVGSKARTADIAGAEADLEALRGVISEAGRKAEALEEARGQAEAYRRSMVAMRAEQEKVFGTPLPPELAAAMDEIDALLVTQALTEPDRIDAAVDAAGDKMPAMEALARALKVDRAQYLRDQERVKGRLAALKSHDQNAEALIQRLTGEVEAKLAEAAAKGNAHDYAAAGLLLDEAVELAAAAEVKADNLAHYNAVLADRKTRLAQIPDPASITEADTRQSVSDEVAAVKKLVTDAEAEAARDTGEYGKALEFLAEVPKEVIRVKQLVKDATAYAAKREDLKTEIGKAKTWDASVTEVGPYMPAVDKLFADSAYEETGSFRKSIDMIDHASAKLGELWKIIGRFSKARAKRRELDEAFKELTTHVAKDGITPEGLEIQADRQAGIDQLNAQSYATAEALLDHALKKCAPAKKKADECHEYREELKKSKGKIDTYDDSSYPDSITMQVEACKYWIGDAEAKASGPRDYGAAKTSAERAALYYGLAKSAYDGAVWATNAAPELADIDQNWPALWGKYQGMATTISGRDGHDFVTVKPLIDDAKAAATTAEAAATAAMPDWPTAKDNLETAINSMYDAQLELDKHDAYKSVYNTAHARWSGLDDDGGHFATRKENIRKGIEEEAKDKAEAGDWNGAEIRLDQCTGDCRILEKDCAAHKEYKPIRDPAVKDLLTKLNQNNPKYFMKTEVEKFIADVAAADALLTDGSYPDALKAIKETKRVGDMLSEKFDTAMTAWGRKKNWVDDEFPKIEDKDIVQDMVAKIKPQIAEMNKRIKERYFAEASEMAARIGNEIDYAKMFVEDHDAYVPALQAAKDALQQMTDVTCEAIEQDIKSVTAHIAAAEAHAKDRVFKNAMASLAKVAPIAGPAKTIGEAYKLYAPVLAEARSKLDALAEDFKGIEPVELRIANQRSLLAKADTPAAARDFVAARQIADEVVATCAEIRSAGTAQGAVDQLAAQISGRTDPDADAVTADIAAVQAELDKLDSHRAHEAIRAQRARIKRLLEDAAAARDKPEPDLKAAQAALNDAAGQCQMARADAEAFAGVDAAVDRATKRLEALQTAYSEPPFTAEMLANAKGNLARCQQDVETGVFSSAMNGLLSARAELDEAERVGKLHELFAAARDPLIPRLDALASHKSRYAVAKQIKAIRALFSGAEGSVKSQDYVSAMDLMHRAKREIDTAELTADMHSNKKIEQEDLEKVLSHPGGEAMLDKIIEGLDPSAQRKACKLALEMRFDLSFTQYTDDAGTTEDTAEDVEGPNIVRLYKTLGMVPEAHTKGNPSVNKVKKFGEGVGTSSFNRWTRDKNIKLRIGRGDEDHSRTINQEYQLGDVLDQCKPVDDVPPPKFSWTTLHEIGHAVDDKNGYMRTNGHQPSHAGWKEYGSDVREIAKAAASKFNYSPKYIEAYLSKSKMDPPPPEGGASQAEWDRARVMAETWCDGIRTKSKIWYSASASANAMIDYNGEKRVYQEAYDNKWVSYLFDKRKEGVAGYQFRAPGEWFAELYAALHTGKMNPSHPARSWLEGL